MGLAWAIKTTNPIFQDNYPLPLPLSALLISLPVPIGNIVRSEVTSSLTYLSMLDWTTQRSRCNAQKHTGLTPTVYHISNMHTYA